MRQWRVVVAMLLTLAVGVLLGRSTSGPGSKEATRVAAVTPPTQVPAPQPPSVAVGSQTTYRVPIDDSPTRGPDDALVTIVEVSDFQCPFCKRVGPTLKQIESTYGAKVRFVFKHNPLPIHDRALPAAVAAEQARVQGGSGKFWAMHDQLFELSPALEKDNLEAAAQRIGLDLPAFRAGLGSERHQARIKRDQALASTLGAGSTPAFFINGRLLVGAQPYPAFQAVIDEELRKAEERVRAGTPASALYASIIENGATTGAAPPQAAGAAGPRAAKVSLRPDDPSRGPRLARATVVVFSDFQCPFCSRAEPTLRELEQRFPRDVRVVWKHQPLTFHPNAMPAAEAAEAARSQGKFWEMHDLMFASQAKLGPESYEAWARQLGLDVKRFKTSIETHQGRARIEEDVKLASSVGATGTPTFFINCRPLVGAKSYDEMAGIIRQELATADGMTKAGTKLDARFYDQICDRNVRATAQAAAAPVQVAIRTDDPSRGKAGAPVTIVAFSDFQCPFCARAEPTLEQLTTAYPDKLRIVWKHQPLSMHLNALPAAVAAEAARQQGKFWEMHDKLFANQQALSPQNYERWAQELGLDLARFRSALTDPKTRARVVEDAQLAGSLGVNGTPTFFINGERVVGASSFEQFKAIIDRQLTRVARK